VSAAIASDIAITRQTGQWIPAAAALVVPMKSDDIRRLGTDGAHPRDPLARKRQGYPARIRGKLAAGPPITARRSTTAL
jgi:hypothetical protein